MRRQVENHMRRFAVTVWFLRTGIAIFVLVFIFSAGLVEALRNIKAGQTLDCMFDTSMTLAESSATSISDLGNAELKQIYSELNMACAFHRGNWTEVTELAKSISLRRDTSTYFFVKSLEQMHFRQDAVQASQMIPRLATRFRYECARDLNTHQCNSALDSCQLAVAIAPSSGGVYAELGRVYTYCFRDLDRAMENYRRAIDLGGQNPSMWMAMAHTLDMEGFYVQASELVQEHGLVGALANAIRANGLRAQGQFAQAIDIYKIAITESGGDPWFYNGLALSYLAIGNRLEALDSWNKALLIDPKFEPALEGIHSLENYH